MCPDSDFFLRRLDVFMHTHDDSKFRYMINISLPIYDFIHPQAEIQSGEACVLTKEDIPSSFSNFAIMVLDVNFINPYKTAGFLFFDDKDDAKKTDNSVVKVKGCLVDVHVDINNLPVFPSDHQILIVSQCLMISWEKSIIEKIIQPNSETLAVVQRQFFFLCGNSFSCAANT